MKTRLTVKEFAARMRITPKTVYARIHDGTLRAINAGKPGSRRPSWRIPLEIVELFEQSRLSGLPGPSGPSGSSRHDGP